MTAFTTRQLSSPLVRMSWPQVLAWHLIPGLALTIAAAAGGAALDAIGLPPLWALLGGVIAIQVPLLLGLRGRLATKAPLQVLHTDPQRRGRQLALFGITLVAALLLPGVATGIEPLVRSSLFGWLPNWWNTGLGSLAAMSESETILTLGLWLVGVVLAGPIVEELYFRGELLPRIPARPWVAAFVNAALFAAYHLWQPYAVLTVFLFALPLAIARARYGATPATCAAVHCLVNLGVFIALVVGLITR